MDDLLTLLDQAGFPRFPLDEEGFPEAGAVVRYYRKQKMRATSSQHQKRQGWTQSDLGHLLGISEVSVRLMENQQTSLDSVTRRRLLARALGIPFALLCPGSKEELTHFLTQVISAPAVSVPSAPKKLSQEHLQLYQDAFLVYSELHANKTAQPALVHIAHWMERMEQHLRDDANIALQQLLCQFHLLSAKINSDDLGNDERASTHLAMALDLAIPLEDHALITATRYRSSQVHLNQRHFHLACQDLDGALQTAKERDVPAQLKAAVATSAGLAHALVARDEAEKTYALSLSEQGHALLDAARTEPDPYMLKFSAGKYFSERADMLINLGRPGKALEALDLAEEQTDPTQLRRHAYINILRSEAYLKQKRPEYDTATLLLASALDTSIAIQSEYINNYVTRLYQSHIAKSPYHHAFAAVQLAMALKQHRK